MRLGLGTGLGTPSSGESRAMIGEPSDLLVTEGNEYLNTEDNKYIELE